MRQAIVTLKKGEGRLLKSGGAWIFDNEIDSIMGEFENGDIVIVHDFDGYGMGRGFINMNSKIRIRMMTRKQDQEIDHELIAGIVTEYGIARAPYTESLQEIFKKREQESGR